MTEAMQTLKRQRVRMMLLNLAYFLALLALGTLIFLKGMGGVAYLLAAACVAVYLLAIRPVSRRYTAAVREAILRYTVCGELTDFRYAPKEGVAAELVRASGLAGTPKTFMSREHVTGRSGTMEVEMAGVTFPVVEDGLNAMFSGAFLRLTWLGADFAPVTVRAGDLDELPKAQRELAEELGSLIPGSLYLRAEGETLTVLLRGRFVGIRINPLMDISEKTLGANVFPELKQTIQLARLMRLRRA